jgi:hypothetical protein
MAVTVLVALPSHSVDTGAQMEQHLCVADFRRSLNSGR